MSLHIAVGLKLDDHKGPFQPSPFYDSMISKELELQLSSSMQCSAKRQEFAEAEETEVQIGESFSHEKKLSTVTSCPDCIVSTYGCFQDSAR